MDSAITLRLDSHFRMKSTFQIADYMPIGVENSHQNAKGI